MNICFFFLVIFPPQFKHFWKNSKMISNCQSYCAFVSSILTIFLQSSCICLQMIAELLDRTMTMILLKVSFNCVLNKTAAVTSFSCGLIKLNQISHKDSVSNTHISSCLSRHLPHCVVSIRVLVQSGEWVWSWLFRVYRTWLSVAAPSLSSVNTSTTTIPPAVIF